MTRDSLNTAVLDSLRMNRSLVVVMVTYILAALVLGRLAGVDVALRIYGGTASLLIVLACLLVLIPIDGYVSIFAVVLIWRAAGWWVSRSESPALVPVPST